MFGSCVECPSWNKCCYKSGDPVCVARNHGCDHIKKVARGNLEDARVSTLVSIYSNFSLIFDPIGNWLV